MEAYLLFVKAVLSEEKVLFYKVHLRPVFD